VRVAVVPDFTVIEGGGRGRGDFHNTRYHLRRLIVELLRALARGNDHDQRIRTELSAFLDEAQTSAAPIDQVIADVISENARRLDRRAAADPMACRR
jgi:hypothetical protein